MITICNKDVDDINNDNADNKFDDDHAYDNNIYSNDDNNDNNDDDKNNNDDDKENDDNNKNNKLKKKHYPLLNFDEIIFILFNCHFLLFYIKII